LDVSMIILAGGKNSRMKKEKAFLTVDDRPMIEKTVSEAKDHCREIIVVTNRPEAYHYLDIVVTSDLIPGRGPLSGIHAGLFKSSSFYNFVVACDMPFISMELAERLRREAENHDVIVPCWDGGLQPLHALYSKNCAGEIEKALHNNVRKVVDVYQNLKVKVIEEEQLIQCDISPRVFFNVNTPEDLTVAQSMVKRKI